MLPILLRGGEVGILIQYLVSSFVILRDLSTIALSLSKGEGGRRGIQNIGFTLCSMRSTQFPMSRSMC